MKYITYLAIFVLLMTPVAMANQFGSTIAQSGSPPIATGTVQGVLIGVALLIVIVIAVGAIIAQVGRTMGGGGGLVDCLDACQNSNNPSCEDNCYNRY